MKLAIDGDCAECPYCGSTDFREVEKHAPPPHELVCARCGGYSSRKLLLDRIREKAAAHPNADRARRRD